MKTTWLSLIGDGLEISPERNVPVKWSRPEPDVGADDVDQAARRGGRTRRSPASFWKWCNRGHS